MWKGKSINEAKSESLAFEINRAFPAYAALAAYKQGTPGFFDLPFYSIASLYSGYVS